MAIPNPLTDEDRENLISEYVTRVIARMSIKEMERIIGDNIEANLWYLPDNDLLSIVKG